MVEIQWLNLDELMKLKVEERMMGKGDWWDRGYIWDCGFRWCEAKIVIRYILVVDGKNKWCNDRLLLLIVGIEK